MSNRKIHMGNRYNIRGKCEKKENNNYSFALVASTHRLEKPV